MTKTLTILFLTIIFTVFPAIGLANSAPVVSNVSASQRADDSKLVDIYYNLADAEGDNCTIWVFISDNNGLSWDIPAFTFTGDVGSSISPGLNKHIVWDAGHDCPGKSGTFRARVFADDGKGDDMVVVPAGNYRFDGGSYWFYVGTFFIDRYEVTNSRYCEFLNAADPNGDHWCNNMEIGRSGSPGNYSYTVSPGKENYPVIYVSFYDANAFADWRSSVTGLNYSVPTIYQWQKAAAWDPVEMRFYYYGCHRDSIDCTWVNYNTCAINTTPVGYYNGTGGRNDAKSYYGCYDMSGNVAEWYADSCSLIGGSWAYPADGCHTTDRSGVYCADRLTYSGFRIVRELE
ncbi:MAG: SUMF1/EgtB/PvdO family nonheme iron enzyme [Planctomycetota bacterium]